MSYLVMECHLGYAIVLCEDGQFIKVANQNYEVGQTLSSVIKMKEAEQSRNSGRWLRSAVAAAACFCLVVVGAWQTFSMPYGSVRMQINPDVLLTVNRMDYVVQLEGMNADGEDLIAGYAYNWKKLDEVSKELTQRAVEQGYLADGGAVKLVVESAHENWKTATETRIILELEVNLGEGIEVSLGSTAAEWSEPIPSGQFPAEENGRDGIRRSDDDGDDRYDDDDDDDDDDNDDNDDDDDDDDVRMQWNGTRNEGNTGAVADDPDDDDDADDDTNDDADDDTNDDADDDTDDDADDDTDDDANDDTDDDAKDDDDDDAKDDDADDDMDDDADDDTDDDDTDDDDGDI